MIEVRHASAKGFGVFAKTLIPRGTRLLAESSLLSINDHSPSILTAARRLTSQNRRILLALSLNRSKQRSLLSLIEAIWRSLPALGSVASNRDILNVFRNNNFNLADAAGTRAVFETIARINHACVPNAQGNFHSGTRQFTVHALRRIRNGEEITISYLDDQLATGMVRREHLMDGYDFACACPVCYGGSKLSVVSEARRADVKRKLGAFAEQNAACEGEEVDEGAELSMMKMLMGTYEAEGLAGRELATIYIAAAKLASRLNRAAEARSLARRGLELEKDAVGIDSPLYIASAATVKSLGL
ncbi:TPR domain-containing protein [Xylariaceae sp. AK1471]|nr:TPR domain-containing protein [Xylariaceae sp. AK1471]